jgi:hypothetical protein
MRVSLLLRCEKLQITGAMVFLFRQTEAGRAFFANMLVKHVNIEEAERGYKNARVLNYFSLTQRPSTSFSSYMYLDFPTGNTETPKIALR